MGLQNLLTISLLILLSACSQKNATVPVKLSFFKNNLVTGAPLNGGVILMGQSEDGLESFRFGITNPNQDFLLELKKGRWDFTAIGWSGDSGIMTGLTRCAYSGIVDLKNTDTSVNLNLSESRCLSSFGSGNHSFSESGFRYPAGGFYSLRPVVCFNATLNSTNCSPTSNASIFKSYKIIFSSEKKGSISNNLSELSSACQLIGGAPVLALPTGDNSGSSTLGFRVVLYPELTCTGASFSENFNTSFKHGVAGNNLRGLESSSNKNYLFINPGFASALNDVKINTGNPYTNNPSVSVSFTSLNPEVTELCFSELSNGSDCIGPSWITTLSSPTPVTLSAGEGIKTIYLYSKNSSNSITLIGQDSIHLDSSPPVFNGVGSFLPIYNSSPVNINWPAYSDITSVQYNVYNCSSNDCLSGCTLLGNTFTSSFNISSVTEGFYNICLEASDTNGNQGPKNYSGTFEYDSIAPLISMFKLNNDAAFSNSLNLSITSSVSGTPDKMCFNENSSTAGCSWVSYMSSVSYSLAPGEGVRNVYMHVKDLAGNIASLNKSINIDTIAPTMPGVASLNPFYNPSELPFNFNWIASIDANLSQYNIKVCSSTDCSTSCAAERLRLGTTPADSIALIDGVNEGLNHICIRAIDTISNQSAYSLVGSFTYDSIAPSTAGVTLAVANGSAFTKTITVNWTKTGSVDATKMCISEASTVGSCSPWFDIVNSGAVALSNTQGAHTLYTFYKDAAQNTSSSQMNNIILDTIPPAGLSLTSPVAAMEIEGNAVTIAYSGGADTHFDKVVARLCNDNGCGMTYASMDLGAGTNVATLVDSSNAWQINTQAVVVLKAYDLAGNFSTVTYSQPITRIFNLKSKEIAFGSSHACFAFSNGNAKCMGTNTQGQLGSGNYINMNGTSPSAMGNNLPFINFGGIKVKNIFAGGESTCAILSNGQLKCWGTNTTGQLGLGDVSNRNVPTLTEVGSRPAIQGAISNSHTCIVNIDGEIKCFGNNQYGQLGLGNTTLIGATTGQMGGNLASVNLGTGKKAIKVGVGNSFSCALLSDRTVKCWGMNNGGQLGLDHTSIIGDGPSEMGDNLLAINFGSGEGVVDLSVAEGHSCVLLASGIAKCWGINNQGQLGTGTTTNHGGGAGSMAALPGINFGGGKKAIEIVAGISTTCAILEDGTSRCWGNNSYGVGGQGHTTPLLDPSVINLDLGTGATVRSIASNSQNACAVLSNGNVKCWGIAIAHGQGVTQSLGTSPGQMGDALTFVRLGTTNILDPMKIASGDFHNCALMYNGQVKCWGSNISGQIGLNIPGGQKGLVTSDMGMNLAFLNFGGSKLVRDISSGGYGSKSTCVQMSNGEMKCWGRNSEGQLGITQTNAPFDIIGDDFGEVSDTMPAINFPSSKKIRSMSVGADTTYAIMTDGSIYCFGQNSVGQCGIENANPIVPNPAIATMLVDKAIQITAGQGHACVLTSAGTTKCWGYGAYGQLGNNATGTLGSTPSSMNSLIEVAMGSAAKAIKLDAGKFSTCALLDNYQVKCWGENLNGVLGQDSNMNVGHNSGNAVSITPAVAFMSTLALSTAIDVETNGFTTCALSTNNSVRCWGDNTNGMLGQNSGALNMGTSSFPTIAGNILDSVLGAMAPVQKLNVGMNACAISVHGPVVCWGNNNYGQAGQGNAAPSYGSSSIIMPTIPINL